MCSSAQETIRCNKGTKLIYKDGHYKTLNPIVDDQVCSVIFPTLKIHTKDIFRGGF